ncbi:MAG TPA: hypothetical protein VK745_08105 [Polyangiaceae bacterium]|nr:hypothetical protein [Polyangiaceae bacterium]
MPSKIRLLSACALLAAVALSGCHHQPPAVAPPPAAAPPAPPPPPPPPPKCEALSENCTATDAIALTIGAQGASIKPPSGWKYAKESERSVAVGADGKSVLSAVEIASAEEPAILEALEKQTLASGIEKVKFEALKKRLKKPQITVDASGTPVELWEVSKSTSNGVSPELREQGVGTLLVFVAKLAPNRVVTGLGFVVVPDAEADAQKVMQAVQTLKGKP